MRKDIVGALVLLIGSCLSLLGGFWFLIFGGIIDIWESFMNSSITFQSFLGDILQITSSIVIIPVCMFISLYIGLKIQGRLSA